MVRVYRDIEMGVKALGNLLRMRILRFLAQEPKTVSEVAEEFHISQPAISSHLKILNDAGFLNKEKKGNEVYYSYSAENLEKFQHFVKNFIEGKELNKY